MAHSYNWSSGPISLAVNCSRPLAVNSFVRCFCCIHSKRSSDSFLPCNQSTLAYQCVTNMASSWRCIHSLIFTPSDSNVCYGQTFEDTLPVFRTESQYVVVFHHWLWNLASYMNILSSETACFTLRLISPSVSLDIRFKINTCKVSPLRIVANE